MKSVFAPINLKMEAIITGNAQLMDGEKFYPVFLEFIAHVESYKATMAAWKDGDDLQASVNREPAANTALINYPDDAQECVRARLHYAFKQRSALLSSWTGLSWVSPDAPFKLNCR